MKFYIPTPTEAKQEVSKTDDEIRINTDLYLLSIRQTELIEYAMKENKTWAYYIGNNIFYSHYNLKAKEMLKNELIKKGYTITDDNKVIWEGDETNAE